MIGDLMLRKIEAAAVAGHDLGRGELVADEQVVDDPLHLLGIEEDVAAPPFLEAQIARAFGVDLGVEIVLLGPERVRGFMFSKFWTSAAPSKMPWPRSPVSAVSQLPPLSPPV